MNSQDYEQKKRECWEEFCIKNPAFNDMLGRKIFTSIFDRAYTLGKQTETISQEEIEKASVEYADKTAKQYEVCNSEFVQEIMVAFEQGVNFALGKREKDAEGEEMLHIRRSEVIRRYEAYSKESANVKNNESYLQFCEGRLNALTDLFGSKCLPDEEPKPAEPKYHAGDWVRVVSTDKHGHIGQITEVEYEYGCNYYQVFGAEGWHFLEKNLEPYTKPAKSKAEPKFKVGNKVRFKYCCTPYHIDGFKMLDGAMLYQVGEVWAEESDLEPYTEPKEDTKQEIKQEIVNHNRHFDTIIKDGFRNERRLNIAAMVMQGIVSNKEATQYAINNFRCSDGTLNRYSGVAECSLAFADALLKEAEKGDNQ